MRTQSRVRRRTRGMTRSYLLTKQNKACRQSNKRKSRQTYTRTHSRTAHAHTHTLTLIHPHSRLGHGLVVCSARCAWSRLNWTTNGSSHAPVDTRCADSAGIAFAQKRMASAQHVDRSIRKNPPPTSPSLSSKSKSQRCIQGERGRV